MLVEGSAPKPLKTRACALRLLGYDDTYVSTGLSIMIEFGIQIHTNCIAFTPWLWSVLRL